MNAKIAVEQLRVTYPGPTLALDGLSLQVGDGELACVVGPSGCGKTTLLRVLAGLEPPTSGRVTIRADNLARPIKGMVFQGAGIFPWMTVAQNVGYGLALHGTTKAEREAIAQHWIHEVGLAGFADRYPAQLSGGMQQRVGLARAFAYDPEVLLMDEPFGALDAQTRLILQELLLAQWERQRKTVMFVTHSIEEALTLGDRIFVLSARPGRLLAEIAVPFERPRDVIQLRGDPRFSALFADVWAMLRQEVQLLDVA